MSDLELEFTDSPVCPKCGHEDIDWWDGGDVSYLKSDGDETNTECPACPYKYNVIVNISHTFTTSHIESSLKEEEMK